MFRDGYDLPAFAAFPLIDTDEGRERLAEYYRAHVAIARAAGAGFVFESVGWRGTASGASRSGTRPRCSTG